MHRAWAWLNSLMLRRRQERDMREEMDQHLERAIARLMFRGMSQAEAERQAHREFGNMDWIRENARDARGHRWVETLVADVKYAFRQFLRTPLAAFSMMLILSLGIGASTGLFTVLHSIRTQPPPSVDADEGLVRIRGLGGPFLNTREFSYPEVQSYAALGDVFDGVAAYTAESVLLRSRADGTIPATAYYVSREYFEVLGVRPAVGSGLPRASSSGAALAAVISDAMWRSDYAEQMDVVGQVVHVNDIPVTIVGVAPPQFNGVSAGRPPSRTLWLPAEARVLTEGTSVAFLKSPDSTLFRAVARLAPSAGMARAGAAARAVASRYRGEEAGEGAPSDVVPLLHENEHPYNDDSFVMLAAVFGTMAMIIVLITCSNVSTLLTGMATVRRREIAVRLSLGAGRRRVVRQLLVESAVLAIGAAAIAFAVTSVAVTAFAQRFADLQLAVPWAAAAWTIGFALVTTLLFGLAPALHATRVSVLQVLKDSAAGVARSRSLLQRALIVVQVMLTQPLLVALTALLVGGAAELKARSTSGVQDRIVRLNFNTWAGSASFEDRRAEFAEVTAAISGVPGVVGVVPARNGHRIDRVVVHPADRVGDGGSLPIRLQGELTAPGYFDLVDIPLVSGREFDRQDTDAVIVGADLARRLWGDANALGRRFVPASTAGRVDSVMFTVVGVADDAVAGASTTSGRERVFLPLPETGGEVLLVRTTGDPAAVYGAFRRIAAEAAPGLPLTGIATLAEEEAEKLRFLMRIGSAAAAGGMLALFLAAFGLYAVIAHAVKQRQREIGIRTALGADPGRVAGLFFRGGLRLSLLGLVLGLPLSVLTLHMLTVQSHLPPTNLFIVSAIVALAVILIAAVASWLPARSAARVDPLQALRLD